ncbi:hypothetical protein NPIL_663361 [Nephila pilipes]|uniref:Uncharacterized protein n=1 Tax=Nephila pilipes TaxID=299642 RepID=A0A8X6MIK0_NEPPI|nr:hypothetical protein NPIL_663361 [Nephila pilipes]
MGRHCFELSCIISTFPHLWMNPRNPVAICYNGGRNIDGIYKHVVARWKKINLDLMYVHCYMDSFNLPLEDVSRCIASNLKDFGTVRQICCFIKASPKRHVVFLK